MGNIRLLIAGDDTLIRITLVNLLDSYTNLTIVGEAKNGQELIKKYRDVKPDVVLCDICMPLMNGLEAADKILNHDKSAKIILFAKHDEEEYLSKAIKVGVSGYVTKFLLESDLRYAIQSVYGGGKFYLRKTDVESEKIKWRYSNEEMNIKFNLLTVREKEILVLVARGLTSDEISNKLFISKRTVDCHRLSIKEKTGLTKRSELADLIKNITQFPAIY